MGAQIRPASLEQILGDFPTVPSPSNQRCVLVCAKSPPRVEKVIKQTDRVALPQMFICLCHLKAALTNSALRCKKKQTLRPLSGHGHQVSEWKLSSLCLGFLLLCEFRVDCVLAHLYNREELCFAWVVDGSYGVSWPHRQSCLCVRGSAYRPVLESSEGVLDSTPAGDSLVLPGDFM